MRSISTIVILLIYIIGLTHMMREVSNVFLGIAILLIGVANWGLYLANMPNDID